MNSNIKRLIGYSQPYKSVILIIVISLLTLSFFAALRPYMVKQIIDDYIAPRDVEGIWLFSIFIVIVLFSEVLSQFLFSYFSGLLGQNIIKDIRKDLFDKIIHFRLKYFDNESVGRLVTRNVSDIESIASIFSQGLFMIVGDLLKMLVVMVIMIYMNWKLSIIVLISMPMLAWATYVFQRYMKSAFQEVRTMVAELNTFVQERVSGMSIVQIFGQEDNEYQKFKALNQKHNTAWQKSILYNSIFFPISDILSSVTLGCIVVYGGFTIIWGENITTTGDLFAYTMMISMLFNPMKHIADKFNVMQMGFIASERVFEVMNSDNEKQNEGTIEAKPFVGDIEFKNVRFSYKKGVEILKGINLHIKPQQTVAIVGASGAGKSTIINLLSRFYDIDSGEITIDGVNIQDFTFQSLRKQIGVVLQDVFLFNDTIFNNITLHNPNITKNQVIEAAKTIGIHHFIESLPNGYDYNVRERGATISSGQRQLLSFLRAYVYNPSILVLDEATSSVDTHSEELIQKATKSITQNRTSIVIAHRLATIVDADVIIVMNKGEIVEQGTHQELINIQGGFYQNLYYSQFNN